MLAILFMSSRVYGAEGIRIVRLTGLYGVQVQVVGTFGQGLAFQAKLIMGFRV